MNSSSSLLPPSAQETQAELITRDISRAQWSTRKTIAVGTVFMIGLWLLCFLLTWLLIHLLPGITY